MNNILWTQNETPTKPSSFVIDGIRSEYDCLPAQDEAMRILNGPILESGKNFQFDEAREKLALSSNFKVICSNTEGILIQGCYEELDESGRKMAYVFVSKNAKKLVEAVETLRLYSSLVNKTLVEHDLENIETFQKMLRRQREKSFFLTLILILVLTIIALSVWNQFC